MGPRDRVPPPTGAIAIAIAISSCIYYFDNIYMSPSTHIEIQKGGSNPEMLMTTYFSFSFPFNTSSVHTQQEFVSKSNNVVGGHPSQSHSRYKKLNKVSS